MARSGIVYLHIKSGKCYLTLLEEVIHTETQEPLTVYSNAMGKLFARPSAMFHDGRFSPTGEDPDTFLWRP